MHHIVCVFSPQYSVKHWPIHKEPSSRHPGNPPSLLCAELNRVMRNAIILTINENREEAQLPEIMWLIAERQRIKTEEEVVVREESGGWVSDAIQGENPGVGL